MAETFLEKPSNIVNQALNNDFEGFTLGIDDSRGFLDILKGQRTDINFKEYFDAGSSGVNAFLDGRKIGVFANGTKIAERTIEDFEFNGNVGSLDLSSGGLNPIGVGDAEDLKFIPESFKNRDLSIRELGDALGIDSLTFRPVKEKVAYPMQDSKEKVSKMSSKSLIVGVGLVVGVYAFYREVIK